jgi:putative ABC transport system ATP-binding protein
MSILKTEQVTKTYGEGDVAVHALAGVDLTIDSGEFVAIAGPSGSGKSTLLNILSGLDRASTGRMWVNGDEITELGDTALSKLRLEKIGFVFQSYNLLPVLTAIENAEYVLMLQGTRKKERREKVMKVLERVGLGGMEDRFPNQLSGGQQQRVAIARAIAADPRLVLADEPTANVDSQTANSLLDLMQELNAEQETTFLFSSHDERVLKRAKRLIVLEDGKITRDEQQNG